MVSAPPLQATTEADEYQTVCDIVNNGVKDLLVEILEKLRNPATFREQVQYLADRQGVPREATEDMDRSFASFWNHCTGLDGELKWRNASAIPERSRSYVQEFKPDDGDSPAATTDASIRWGISLPFGIGFHT
ncbi:hypothetical protein [Streptomyces sp. NRRL S-118]|uniref:hypothetical protein n=1 Tax=Streptomyces sp. NRRL S-118 TaxID=1463881 RepID=UPI00131BDF23|nr:hypothetical protein [Streptomyces sp. NRRL S-118]